MDRALDNNLTRFLRLLGFSDDTVNGGGGGGSGGGNTALSGPVNEGSRCSSASTRIFAAIRSLGAPILMVQSTEDALIGSPLALVLRQEVGAYLLPSADNSNPFMYL